MSSAIWEQYIDTRTDVLRTPVNSHMDDIEDFYRSIRTAQDDRDVEVEKRWSSVSAGLRVLMMKLMSFMMHQWPRSSTMGSYSP